MFRLVTVLTFACSLLTAQDAPLQATLSPIDIVAKVSAQDDAPPAELGFRLVLNVAADTEVPATLLSGHRLQTWLDGEESRLLADEVAGTITLKKGTKIERELRFTAESWAGVDLSQHRTLTVQWPGYETAKASVRLVSDQSHLDLAQLDHAKSKVRLITNYGDMVVGFYPDKAPQHVANFLKLSKDGFYNGTRFHRIIRNFMIQGGCPNTKAGATGRPGTGNPGWTVPAEFNDLKHKRGILSMARANDPNSAGCQFFVMHGQAPALDNKYSIFGMLEEGFEVLDKIAESKVTYNGRELSEPVEPVHLFAAEVLPVFKN